MCNAKDPRMDKINLNAAMGASVFAFCLLLFSNYIGNILIPEFNTDYAIKNASYDWIKWPETKNEVSPKTNVHKIKNLDIEKEVSKSEQSIETYLLSATVANGKKVARKCVACHSFNKGGKNKIGPNLYEIMGRERGLTSGYNYSKALKKMGGKWNYSDMNNFLLQPRKFMPGTKMSFKGIKNANDRAAIILYMRSYAEVPIPLPE